VENHLDNMIHLPIVLIVFSKRLENWIDTRSNDYAPDLENVHNCAMNFKSGKTDYF